MRLKKFLLGGMVGLSLLSAAPAFSATVTKSFRFDENMLGFRHNYHAYRYVNIPNWSKYTGQSTTKVGGDWNYNRYETIFYYSGLF